MESAENIVLKLNEILEDDKFSTDDFEKVIKQLKEDCKVKIKLLDFRYYNEYRRALARKEKIKNIKIQEFETAACWRDLEKDCLSLITLRKEYKIEKSAFYYEKGYVFYFYLGFAKNDERVKFFF